MLSNHEFVTEVRDKLFPVIRGIEKSCLDLFNKEFCPGRGPTGVVGSNEVAWVINYLMSAAAILRRLAQEHNIEVPDMLCNQL